MVHVRKAAAAAPLALAASLALVGCSDDSAGPEQGTDVEDVAEADPDENDREGPDLLGQRVTVSGEATELAGPTAFWIGGDLLGGDSVLVLSSSGSFEDATDPVTEETVENDTVLQVRGTVRELDIAALEDEFDVDYDDDALEDHEGDAVIVAEQVATLAGEGITLAGNVSDLLSTVAFQLVGSGWTVVVLDADQAAVEPGEYVQVQGTVRQLDIAELEEEFGNDLDDAVYEAYEGDLVLVAENVSPVMPVEPTE